MSPIITKIITAVIAIIILKILIIIMIAKLITTIMLTIIEPTRCRHVDAGDGFGDRMLHLWMCFALWVFVVPSRVYWVYVRFRVYRAQKTDFMVEDLGFGASGSG